MTRRQYLEEVIALFLEAPDTPKKARRSDWGVATTFYQQAIPLGTIAHAIRLTAVRRLRRGLDLPSLEPICSLAYLRPMLRQLSRQPHDRGYVEFVRCSYRDERNALGKTAGHRQSTALSDRR